MSAEAGEEGPSSPWRAEDPTGATFRLMQYNPPYTLPWRRTNAIAIRVTKDPPVPPEPLARDEDTIVSEMYTEATEPSA